MCVCVCIFFIKKGSRWEKREGRENETAFQFLLWRRATQGWCWVQQLFLFHAGDIKMTGDGEEEGVVMTQDRGDCGSGVPERGRGQLSWAQGQSRWGGWVRGEEAGLHLLHSIAVTCGEGALWENLRPSTHNRGFWSNSCFLIASLEW